MRFVLCLYISLLFLKAKTCLVVCLYADRSGHRIPDVLRWQSLPSVGIVQQKHWNYIPRNIQHDPLNWSLNLSIQKKLEQLRGPLGFGPIHTWNFRCQGWEKSDMSQTWAPWARRLDPWLDSTCPFVCRAWALWSVLRLFVWVSGRNQRPTSLPNNNPKVEEGNQPISWHFLVGKWNVWSR